MKPIEIGPHSIANRLYFGPHGTPLEGGRAPSEDFAAYFAERAAAGVGLLIHSLPINPRAGIGRACPTVDESVPAFAAVADRIHAAGGKLFAQLNYFFDLNTQWDPQSPFAPSLTPSGQPRFTTYSVTRAMTKPDIDAMVGAFGRAVANLRKAGYDGIELHATHGMLPEMFLSGYFNRRTDDYGGVRDNRVRFLMELLTSMRAAASPSMAVGMRFQCDERLPGGITSGESREVLSEVVARGLIDFVDLDMSVEPKGSREAIPNYFLPQQFFRPFVEAVREGARSIPVLSALGRITSIADADELIASGVVDMIGVVRGLIAEPNLLANAESGNESHSRTCIGANMCQDRRQFGTFGCAINPATGRERRWGAGTFGIADRPGKVVVVGGGPAGLEAARVAALQGHSVVLAEREAQLGGQLVPWSALPGRELLATTVEWYWRELDSLGVDVRVGNDASADSILAERPDGVIVATGSSYVGTGESGFDPRPIPGAERDFVVTPESVFAGRVDTGGRVLVLDDEGLNTGCGVAEVLANGGAEVHYVTRWAHAAMHLTGTFESEFILPRLKKLRVQMHTQTHARSIGDRCVTVFDIHTGVDRVVDELDAVVLVTMRRQHDPVSEHLIGRVGQVFLIGDALAPRALTEATFEGQRFARLLGMSGAPRDFTEAYWEPIRSDTFPRPASALPVPNDAG